MITEERIKELREYERIRIKEKLRQYNKFSEEEIEEISKNISNSICID